MFSKRLKLLRKERNLTQNELADILHIKNTTISNYENEVSSPDMDMIGQIASFFNVSTDYLLGKSDTKEDINSVDVAFYEQHGIVTDAQKRELKSFIEFLNHKEQEENKK